MKHSRYYEHVVEQRQLGSSVTNPDGSVTEVIHWITVTRDLEDVNDENTYSAIVYTLDAPGGVRISESIGGVADEGDRTRVASQSLDDPVTAEWFNLYASSRSSQAGYSTTLVNGAPVTTWTTGDQQTLDGVVTVDDSFTLSGDDGAMAQSSTFADTTLPGSTATSIATRSPATATDTAPTDSPALAFAFSAPAADPSQPSPRGPATSFALLNTTAQPTEQNNQLANSSEAPSLEAPSLEAPSEDCNNGVYGACYDPNPPLDPNTDPTNNLSKPGSTSASDNDDASDDPEDWTRDNQARRLDRLR